MKTITYVLWTHAVADLIISDIIKFFRDFSRVLNIIFRPKTFLVENFKTNQDQVMGKYKTCNFFQLNLS